MNLKVIAIIPCYREAARVGEVVRRARPHVDAVAVIDDGSPDATAEEAARAGAVVVRHRVNQGKGFAIRTGIRHAMENGFDLLIFLDGDGQHNPEKIPDFLEAQRTSHASIVVGNRMNDVRKMPTMRKWTNQLTSWILSRMAGQRIADSQCGFRLLHKSVIPDLHMETGKFDTESEILIHAGRHGHRIMSVPIDTIYEGQQTESKIRPVLDTVRFCKLIWRNRRHGGSKDDTLP